MSTRTYLIIVPVLSLLLCGCGKENLNTGESNGGTETPKVLIYEANLCGVNSDPTKGTLINTSDPGWKPLGDYSDIVDKFYVTAWETVNKKTTQIISQWETVNYVNGSWKGKSHFWEDGITRVFYAYANVPSSEVSPNTSITSTSTIETLTYNPVPADAFEQTDILLGYYKGDGDLDKDGVTEGTASIKFHHPLTSVLFKVGDMGGHEMTFTNVQLNDVYKSGKTAWTAKDSDMTSPENSNFTWGSLVGYQNVYQACDTGLEICDNGPVKNQIGTSFILIPQNMSTKQSSVEVWCREGNKEYHLKASLPKTHQWKAGTANVYTLGYDVLTAQVYLVEERETIDGGTIGL